MKKIQPLGNRIQIKIEDPKAGALDLSSRPSAIEFGEVIGTGPMVTMVKKGDKVFFKAWAVDIVRHDKETYYFIAEDTNGLCAIVT